jgi:hypothetical protein
MAFSKIQYGDVATWALVLITILAVLSALRVVQIERLRDQVVRNEKRRSQASLVAAWAVHRTDRPEVPFLDLYHVDIVCHNGSSQPIYDVSTYLFVTGAPIDFEDGIGFVPPTSHVSLEITPSDLQSSMRWVGPFNLLSQTQAEDAVAELRVEIHFTDAENRRWSRGKDGLLFQIKWE